MQNLESIREKISVCDDKIIQSLAERMNYIEEIIDYKKEAGIPILQPEQEKKQFSTLKAKLNHHQYEEEILNIFKYIVRNSKKIQAKSLFSYNIMLIGFMGTGKTTVSTYLSKMLAMEEIEMDQMIAEREGMSITDIFDIHGEDYFRNCESQLLVELQEKNNAVISCGGGVVLREKNIESMKKRGRIVLLTASPKSIYERVRHSNERPLLNNNMNVPYIAKLMEKRRSIYQHAADITINTDNKTIQQICEELIKKIISIDE